MNIQAVPDAFQTMIWPQQRNFHSSEGQWSWDNDVGFSIQGIWIRS